MNKKLIFHFLIEINEVHKFDEKGNMIEEVHYENGEMKEKHTYRFDEKGNMTEEGHYGENYDNEKYAYRYDERGNRIERKRYGDNDKTLKSCRVIEVVYYE